MSRLKNNSRFAIAFATQCTGKNFYCYLRQNKIPTIPEIERGPHRIIMKFTNALSSLKAVKTQVQYHKNQKEAVVILGHIIRRERIELVEATLKDLRKER